MTIAMPSTDKLEPFNEDLDFKVSESPLGDGYIRTAPEGDNNVRRKFTLRWVKMDASEAHTLRDALKATKGTETVTWTPPDEASSINLKLKSLSCKWVDGVNKQVSAKFEEHFL